MNLVRNKFSFATVARIAVGALSIAMLASCGGGGGSPGVAGGGGSTGTTREAKLALAVIDGSGATISTLSGGQNATARATFSDGSGAPVSGAIVTFEASDEALLEFTPVSKSALTDNAGVAVINIKPKTFTSAGALTIKASAIKGTVSATSSANIAVGAAPLTVGNLSWNPAPVGSLPAFSTITLNVPVTSGGQPVSTVSGLTLTSLCVGDGAATIVPGAVVNGVQMATYTNNGCNRGTDTVTASIGNSMKTISLNVDPANIGTIQFIGSDLAGSSIVLKGSGGLGRKEAAILTFKVVDQNNNGLAGVDVNFRATTTTGGLTVLPAKGTTDASGNVTTTVSSGTIPTPVRVIAEATRNGRIISGLSDSLTVSTGLPIQRFMSFSADKYNIEGLEYDGEIANVTIRLADQYGNKIADNTTVNFVTEGGAIGTSAQGACNTVDGGCTVRLQSQQFKPVNGRVTVLAYAQGVEDFVDSNGDGQYSCAVVRDADGNVPVTYRPLVDTCVSGGEPHTDMGDPFLDAGSLAKTAGVSAGTLDGKYDAVNGDLPFPYNSSTYSASGNGKWGINYISRTAEFVFSGSFATLIRQVCSASGCRDWAPADGDPSIIQGVGGPGCSSRELTFRLIDVNNNPMPNETKVEAADANKITPQTFFPDKVLSTNAVGGTFHSVVIKANDQCEHGNFLIKVTTPKGNGSAFSFRSQ
ncbi:Ig-like domain-containing protein [Noviherbaspirillum sp.]|uniref:Ig-like domain-containing protein n=1 Tax=Noviherbaspirillum sp. TaxID=1926288 RepID=UPI002FE040E7